MRLMSYWHGFRTGAGLPQILSGVCFALTMSMTVPQSNAMTTIEAYTNNRIVPIFKSITSLKNSHVVAASDKIDSFPMVAGVAEAGVYLLHVGNAEARAEELIDAVQRVLMERVIPFVCIERLGLEGVS